MDTHEESPEPTKPKPKRCSAEELKVRVEEVLQLLLAGAGPWDVEQYAKQKQWEVTEKTLRRYRRAAEKALKPSIEKRRDKLLTLHLAKLRDLYAKALNNGDVRTALLVLKSEQELMGLCKHDKKERTTTNFLTIEQLRVAIAPLLAIAPAQNSARLDSQEPAVVAPARVGPGLLPELLPAAVQSDASVASQSPRQPA